MEHLTKYGVDPEKDVCYTSLTGKAVQVLSHMNNKNVSTLHKLLYTTQPIGNGEFRHIPKDIGEIDYKIVVVDEVSMVSLTLMKELARHPVYVICLGDPYQLPSIYANEDNHLLDKPHIFLDEIHRQALDNEIIRLSMDIRTGKNISHFNGKDVKVLDRNTLSTGMLNWADQVICATNDNREILNRSMRESLNISGLPQENDKVICNCNYWDILDSKGDALINGTIGWIKNVKRQKIRLPMELRVKKGQKKSFDALVCNLETEIGSVFNDLILDINCIDNGNQTLEWSLLDNIRKHCPEYYPLDFSYGYSVTCHKAQGSQWNNVLVLEEKFPNKKEEHLRWLYTACTRPSDKLVLIRKE